MKAVILAGGLGTRLSEETVLRPKPMVEIGSQPILWHIMKGFSVHGIHDFIICAGYRSYVIKEYFANYFLHQSDISFDMKDNRMEVLEKRSEPWRVTIIDTGEDSMTGGRLKRVGRYLDEEPFCFTYGDGVSDVDISKLVTFHRNHGKQATVTAVQPLGRFGALEMEGSGVKAFQEKPKGDGSWINGGFFVLNPSVLELIRDDFTVWEQEPLRQLAEMGNLEAYRHEGFWQPMDTLRDKMRLEELWESGKAPWKIW
ncbi:MAG: glucose-1-phosphate cytidylyltransferase [Blastochloris sp.]|nr:glucose-1-phosphate cytidylyltransferase [Blastochloris sp.]